MQGIDPEAKKEEHQGPRLVARFNLLFTFTEAFMDLRRSNKVHFHIIVSSCCSCDGVQVVVSLQAAQFGHKCTICLQLQAGRGRAMHDAL